MRKSIHYHHFIQCYVHIYISAYIYICLYTIGFPGGSSSKELPGNARDVRNTSSILDLGQSPGGEHGNPLQYSCLENTHGQGKGCSP